MRETRQGKWMSRVSATNTKPMARLAARTGLSICILNLGCEPGSGLQPDCAFMLAGRDRRLKHRGILAVDHGATLCRHCAQIRVPASSQPALNRPVWGVGERSRLYVYRLYLSLVCPECFWECSLHLHTYTQVWRDGPFCGQTRRRVYCAVHIYMHIHTLRRRYPFSALIVTYRQLDWVYVSCQGLYINQMQATYLCVY